MRHLPCVVTDDSLPAVLRGPHLPTQEGSWNDKEPRLTSVPLRPDLPPMPAISSEIIFTYDVVWEHSDIAWASRWDLYLYMGDDQVHWFSILNSLVIVLLLSGIVAMIMVRTLRRDLAEHLRKPNKCLFFCCCGCR